MVADLGPLNNAICNLSYMYVCAYAIDSKSGQLASLSLSLSLRQHELHEGRGPRDETRQDRLQAPTEDCRSLRPSEGSRTATSPNFDRESEREAGKGLQLEGEPEFFLDYSKLRTHSCRSSLYFSSTGLDREVLCWSPWSDQVGGLPTRVFRDLSGASSAEGGC